MNGHKIPIGMVQWESGARPLIKKHLLRHSMSWKNRCGVASTVGADLAVRASPLEVYLFQA